MNAALQQPRFCALCGRGVLACTANCYSCGFSQRPDHAAVQRCVDRLVSESFALRQHTPAVARALAEMMALRGEPKRVDLVGDFERAMDRARAARAETEGTNQ